VHVNMSAQAQAYDYYRKASIETVSSEKLLIMLYDGAIRFLGNAQKAIDDKDVEKAHNQIVKVEDIIIELMSTLDMQYAISSSLYSLYEYMYRRLVEANIAKDQQMLEDVKSFLVQLRDTWAEAIEIIKTENRSQAGNAQTAPAAGEAAPAATAPVAPADPNTIAGPNNGADPGVAAGPNAATAPAAGGVPATPYAAAAPAASSSPYAAASAAKPLTYTAGGGVTRPAGGLNIKG